MSTQLYQTNRGKDSWLIFDISPKASTTAFEYVVAHWRVNTTATGTVYNTSYFKIYDAEEDNASVLQKYSQVSDIVGLPLFDSLASANAAIIDSTAGSSAVPSQALNNCIRYGPYKGTFAAGNWTLLNYYLKTSGQTNAQFLVQLDIFKSSSPAGTGATKLNSTVISSNTVTTGVDRAITGTATSTYLTTTATWAAPSITLDNEYIFVKPVIQFTTSASSVVLNQIVLSSRSTQASAPLITPDFTFDLVGVSSVAQTSNLTKIYDQKTLASNLSQLSPDTLITLFELDATSQGVTEILRFHSGVNELNTDIVFNGHTYYRYPIEASGFEWSSTGTLPRPTLTAANIDGAITSLAMLHGDLLGAKLTRIRTFLKYIDAVNFSSGKNPLADPTVKFPDEVWTIDRKSKESKVAVEFELSAAFDITGVKLPRRQFVQNSCTWRYRRWNGTTWVYDEPSCPYTGTAKFDSADNPVTDPYLDVCSKRLSSCETRFATLVSGNEKPILPFGGFPGVGLIR